ncbi:AMP-binding protein [Thermogymnomonas acidicola]|uniref:AMP-binding protein n=1 Tax=Thermogymnomonas acidicola TaxID=399579 RepID=UPI0014941D2A|nr:AMP-binding protein [Thermogymnomonas acidicola]
MEEENNRQAFHDGWYFTGDRAYVDADGYFWYVGGRSDDVIKSSGYRIAHSRWRAPS